MYIDDETFHIECDKIIVLPGRMRTEVDPKQIGELAFGIAAVGQLHPIIITRENVLVVGECRLRAIKELGRKTILARYADASASDKELKAMEYIENVRRIELSWRDRIKSTYEYHELMLSRFPDWTVIKTAYALSLSEPTISEYLRVYGEMLGGDENVINASSLTSASNVVKRKIERAIENELEGFAIDIEPDIINRDRRPEFDHRPAFRDITHQDFLTWTRPGPRFNLIHCDFPYGIEYGKSGTQSAIAEHGAYDDSEDVYWKLCSHLVSSDLVAETAHILFWFSMNHYSRTRKFFQEAGWIVNPFPLIWFKSDGTGILPDPNRGPRRVYETCFLMTRGDRKIVKAVSNLIALPANKEKALHVSEKPRSVVEYFLSMLIDGSTIFLDPTCGSGTAVLAAEALGAARVTGLEINKEHAENAATRLSIFRRTRGDALGESGEGG